MFSWRSRTHPCTPWRKRRCPCRAADWTRWGVEGDSLIRKIDVEGQEKQVLDGATGLFRARRIKAVYLDGYKDAEIETFLRDQGFTLLDGKTLEPVAGKVFSLLALADAARKQS